MDRQSWQQGSTSRAVKIINLLFLPPYVKEIRITKILLGKDVVRFEDEGHTKFFNRMFPITL